MDKNFFLLKEWNVIYFKIGEVVGVYYGLVVVLKVSIFELFCMYINMSGEYKFLFERFFVDLIEECKEYEDVIFFSEEFFNSVILDLIKCERLLFEFESVNVICYLWN